MDRRPNFLASTMPHDTTLMRWLWQLLYAGFFAAATAIFLHPYASWGATAMACVFFVAPFAIALHRVRFPCPHETQTAQQARRLREGQMLRCTIGLQMHCPELFARRPRATRPRATMKP